MSRLDGPFSNYQFDPRSDRGDDANAPYRGGILGPLGPSWWGAGVDLPAQAPSGFPAVPAGGPASPRNVQAATSPQTALSGLGRDPGPQNPLMGLLSGFGDAVGGLFGGGQPQSPASPGMLQQMAAPGLLDRLTAGANNLTTGGNPIAGLLNAVNGLATGQRTDRAGLALAQQQATMHALMDRGIDADTARAAAVSPDFLKALIASRYGMAAPQQAAAAARPSPDRVPARPGPLANPVIPPTKGPARPLVRVGSPAEAAKLPRGTHFIDSQNRVRVVP